MVFSSSPPFVACEDPFYSELEAVNEAGDWLEFSSPMELTLLPKLFIRPAFRSIAAQALSPSANGRKYVFVTGTPGIGKSMFLYYVLWRLVKQRRRVLFLTTRPMVYFTGERMMCCKELPAPHDRDFWTPGLWCLVDRVDPTSISRLPYFSCSVLLAGAMRSSVLGRFRKLLPQVFYMPVWSKEELSALSLLYPDASSVWKHRFEILGGVPRMVRQNIRDGPQELLTQACLGCSRKKSTAFLSVRTEVSELAQSLIHAHSEAPYLVSTIQYASQAALQAIARFRCTSANTMRELEHQAYCKPPRKDAVRIHLQGARDARVGPSWQVSLPEAGCSAATSTNDWIKTREGQVPVHAIDGRCLGALDAESRPCGGCSGRGSTLCARYSESRLPRRVDLEPGRVPGCRRWHSSPV